MSYNIPVISVTLFMKIHFANKHFLEALTLLCISAARNHRKMCPNKESAHLHVYFPLPEVCSGSYERYLLQSFCAHGKQKAPSVGQGPMGKPCNPSVPCKCFEDVKEIKFLFFSKQPKW